MKKLNLIVAIAAFAFFTFSLAANAQTPNCGNTDYSCKVDAYTKAIAADPGNIENYYSRARAYQDMRSFELAVADFTKYIGMKPAQAEYLADGYTARGNCYRSLGKYALALDDQNAAIRTNGEQAIFYNNRGLVYHAMSNSAQALADFARALVLDPKYSEAFYNRSRVYYADKSYSKAISDLDRYVELNTTNIPWLADGYDNRGLAYMGLGNLDQALRDYTKAIELDATNALRFKHRAAVYRKLGKIDLALTDEKIAADLDK